MNELTYFIIKMMIRDVWTELQYKCQSWKRPKVRHTVKQRLVMLLWWRQWGGNKNFCMPERETRKWVKSHYLQKNQDRCHFLQAHSTCLYQRPFSRKPSHQCPLEINCLRTSLPILGALEKPIYTQEKAKTFCGQKNWTHSADL